MTKTTVGAATTLAFFAAVFAGLLLDLGNWWLFLLPVIIVVGGVAVSRAPAGGGGENGRDV